MFQTSFRAGISYVLIVVVVVVVVVLYSVDLEFQRNAAKKMSDNTMISVTFIKSVLY